MGPSEMPKTIKLGADFEPSRPWRMYHGQKVPGFPMHPHRGFETITIVVEGTVDHFDSGGGSGRYSDGDIQWMTAGSGIQHCEMFPLLNQEGDNPLELFQIWLNLPQKDKFAVPSYKMLWSENVPTVKVGQSEIRLISGGLGKLESQEPTPKSWANDKDNHVRLMTIDLNEGDVLYLKTESETVLRSLYHYSGDDLCLCLITPDEVRDFFTSGEGLYADAENKSRRIAMAKGAHICTLLPAKQMAALENVDLLLWAERGSVKLLYMAAEPIHEPIAQYGPFVMNTRAEIQQAYWDYENSKFGGWPWKNHEPVHPSTFKRQALYSDGSISVPKAP